MLRLEEEDDRSRSTPLGKPEHTHTLSIIRSNRGLFRFFHLKRNKSVRKFATIVVVGKRVLYFYTSDYYNTRPVMRHHQYRTRHPLMDSNRKSFSPLSPLCPFLLKKRQRERIFFFLLAFALNNNTMERKDCFSLLLAGSSTFFGGHFGPCPGGVPSHHSPSRLPRVPFDDLFLFIHSALLFSAPNNFSNVVVV